MAFPQRNSLKIDSKVVCLRVAGFWSSKKVRKAPFHTHSAKSIQLAINEMRNKASLSSVLSTGSNLFTL